MIVATLLAASPAELEAALREAGTRADLLEIRLDTLREPIEPKHVRRLTTKPLIATVRRTEDGGHYQGPEATRLARLRACLDAGFEYVDVEVNVDWDGPAERTIRSHHDLETPRTAEEILAEASRTASRSVYKSASRADTFADQLHVLAAARRLQSQKRTNAIMGLGPHDRALLPLFGSTWTYAGLHATAPGQPKLQHVRHRLEHWGQPRPAGTTYLIVGDPVDHSLSPRLHNAGFQAEGHDANYGALQVQDADELRQLLVAAPRIGLGGLSVTTPLKDAAYEASATRTPEAEAAQAVNCIRLDADAVSGHNTDGPGARDLVHRLRLPRETRILLLGAGPAARSIASQLRDAPVDVAARRPATAAALARIAGCGTAPWPKKAQGLRHGLLINATSALDPVPLLGYRGALFDLHYAASATPWQAHANANQLPWISGRDLLREQGRHAYRFWTGHDPPTPAFDKALEAHA